MGEIGTFSHIISGIISRTVATLEAIFQIYSLARVSRDARFLGRESHKGAATPKNFFSPDFFIEEVMQVIQIR